MKPYMTRQFPDGFDWGTATAAHQIEGGNVNNDWWAFEHTPGPEGAPRTEDPSGVASRATASPSSGAASSPSPASGHTRRSTTTAASARRCSRVASTPS
jgi:hypothetical protein